MSRLGRALLAHPVDTVRTGWWCARAVPSAKRAAHLGAGTRLELPAPPPAPAACEPAVHFVLQRSRQSCFVVALVRQAWMHSHGEQRDLVVGVLKGDEPFKAHAWLDGDDPGAWAGYGEIARWRYGDRVQAAKAP